MHGSGRQGPASLDTSRSAAHHHAARCVRWFYPIRSAATRAGVTDTGPRVAPERRAHGRREPERGITAFYGAASGIRRAAVRARVVCIAQFHKY